jgi:hypothetical protein
VSGDGGDGGGPHMFAGSDDCIPTVYMYKYAMQKYFHETIKYEKMNDYIFIFFCLHSKYFLWGFMLLKSYLHGA